jgi:hypothetical protein
MAKIQLDKKIRGGAMKLPSDKEIASKINEVIKIFVKDKVKQSYQRNWSLLIPVLTKCIEKAPKTKFNPDYHPRFWGISRSVQINKLYIVLNIAVKENDINTLWIAIYKYILWFNDKKKLR